MNRHRIVIVDDLGTELNFVSAPRRIVSLVPSVTETLIELGAAPKVVGATNYCVFPEDIVRNIPKVGGTKGIAMEKIQELQPDLVIANKEENRKHHIEKLRESYPVYVTYPRTVAAAIKMVQDLAILSMTEAAAAAFAGACRVLLDERGATTDRELRSACMIWREPWMVAGPDSYMSDLLETFGFCNIITNDDGRYPEMTMEEILDRKPEVIILPSEPYEFRDRDRDEVENQIRRRNASTKTLLIDGSLLTWFGTRTLLGLRFLAGAKRDFLKVLNQL